MNSSMERRLETLEREVIPDQDGGCVIVYDPDEPMPAPPEGCRVAILLPREAPMSKYELPSETEAGT